jgi:LytR cell envelope-related transcriptional attenuator
VVGAILLVAGAAFGITQLTGGGSDSTTSGSAKKGKGPCPPSQTKVAVLNGTATPGLAAESAAPLKQHGYKVGPVGNTTTPFTTSVVMFDPTDGSQCAPVVGNVVGIAKTQPMNNEVRTASEGNPVAVILGDDKAGESSTTGVSDTTGSGI